MPRRRRLNQSKGVKAPSKKKRKISPPNTNNDPENLSPSDIEDDYVENLNSNSNNKEANLNSNSNNNAENDENEDCGEMMYYKLYKDRSRKVYKVLINTKSGKTKMERQKICKIKFSDILDPKEVKLSFKLSLLSCTKADDIDNYSVGYLQSGNSISIDIGDFDLGPSSSINWMDDELLFTLIKQKTDKISNKKNKKDLEIQNNEDMNEGLKKAEVEILEYFQATNKDLYNQVIKSDGLLHTLCVKRFFTKMDVDSLGTFALNHLSDLAKKRQSGIPPTVPTIEPSISPNTGAESIQSNQLQKLKEQMMEQQQVIRELKQKQNNNNNNPMNNYMQNMMNMNMMQNMMQNMARSQTMQQPMQYGFNAYQPSYPVAPFQRVLQPQIPYHMQSVPITSSIPQNTVFPSQQIPSQPSMSTVPQISNPISMDLNAKSNETKNVIQQQNSLKQNLPHLL